MINITKFDGTLQFENPVLYELIQNSITVKYEGGNKI